jgi:hypothetical protein
MCCGRVLLGVWFGMGKGDNDMTLYEQYPTFNDYTLANCGHKSFRYGQAFCNYFNITWTELFYEIERFEAIAMIENHPHYKKLV